jgi:hypothetical protein
MNDIKRLFAELNQEIFKISLLQSFTDTIIFFLVALNITTLLRVKFYFALGTAFLFLIGDVMYRMKKTTLDQIELKNPNVRDILRTAKDNENRNSFMILAMFEDLIQRMKEVSASSILNQRKLLIKTLIVCLLSFSVIMTSANNIHVPKSVFDINNYYNWFSKPGQDRLDFYTIEFNDTEGLYGNPEMAALGNRTLEIQISPSVNEISFEHVKEPEEKEFERGTFPSEVAAVSDTSSEEKLPKESKIAIAYNLKLKEISK